jgi:archaellum component FlaC
MSQEKIADEMHNLGLEIGKLVDDLQNAKQAQSNNQELENICNHAQQIKDKYNTLASDLVKFSRNQS